MTPFDLPDTIAAHHEAMGTTDSITSVWHKANKVVVSRTGSAPVSGRFLAWNDVWSLETEADAVRWIQVA